jgi:hypothetical protein
VDAEGVRVRLPGLEREYLGLGGGAAKYAFTIKREVAKAADADTLRSALAVLPPPPPGRPRLNNGLVSPRQ